MDINEMKENSLMEPLTEKEKLEKINGPDSPSYFCCGRNQIPEIQAKAEKEATRVIKEFNIYYTGDVGIAITVIEHRLCYSIGAILMVNGESVREYDDAGLCFLDLDLLMLGQLNDRMRRRTEYDD